MDRVRARPLRSWLLAATSAALGVALHFWLIDWSRFDYVPVRDLPPPDALWLLEQSETQRPNMQLRELLKRCGAGLADTHPVAMQRTTKCLRRAGYDPTDLPPRVFTHVEEFGLYPAAGRGRGVALLGGVALPTALGVLAVVLLWSRARPAAEATPEEPS